jgi:hypothetical protein
VPGFNAECILQNTGDLNVHALFVNNHLDAQFFFMYVYFYSLRVSGSHVPIISLIQTRTLNGHLYRVTYTRCCIDTINSPGDGHVAAQNM